MAFSVGEFDYLHKRSKHPHFSKTIHAKKHPLCRGYPLVQYRSIYRLIEDFLTEASEGSGESVKYRSGDPILGKNFFFPVSICQTTRAPSVPPKSTKLC